MQPLSAEQQDEVKQLIGLMKDPRYWRDHDPELVRTVHTGLRRIFRSGPSAGHGDERAEWIVPRRPPALAARANAGSAR